MRQSLAVFEAERDRLFGIAYRMLGSVADAEDVVQEAYLRWADRVSEPAGVSDPGPESAGPEFAGPESSPGPAGGGRDGRSNGIDNPAAYLTTVVSRLAVDRLRSAQVRREQYVGPWLPEPVTIEPGPDDEVILAESLTVGFLALLERLGPVERAVFLLHDVFSVPFDEVATAVGRTTDNCRQIARRARQRIEAERVRYAPEPEDQTALVEAFLAAVVSGEIEALERLLAADVVHVSDGGAKAHAARRPIIGRERVARFLLNLGRRLPATAEVQRVTINGEPAIVVVVDGVRVVAMVFRIVEAQIIGLWAIVNPDKLAALDFGPGATGGGGW